MAYIYVDHLEPEPEESGSHQQSEPIYHGLQLTNRYSGLPATVVSWDVVTDTVILKLSCGQEADYSIQQIAELWQRKRTEASERELDGQRRRRQNQCAFLCQKWPPLKNLLKVDRCFYDWKKITATPQTKFVCMA